MVWNFELKLSRILSTVKMPFQVIACEVGQKRNLQQINFSRFAESRLKRERGIQTRPEREREREREREPLFCKTIAQRVHFGSSHGLNWVETNWLNSNLHRESKNLDRLAKRNKTDGFPALWLKPYGSKQRTAPVPEKVMEMLVFCILSLYWAEMSRKIVPPGFWHQTRWRKQQRAVAILPDDQNILDDVSMGGFKHQFQLLSRSCAFGMAMPDGRMLSEKMLLRSEKIRVQDFHTNSCEKHVHASHCGVRRINYTGLGEIIQNIA